MFGKSENQIIFKNSLRLIQNYLTCGNWDELVIYITRVIIMSTRDGSNSLPVVI